MSGKSPNIQKLILLNNPWVKEELKGETKKYVEWNENINTTNQNLQDIIKALLTGKEIVFFVRM